MKPALTAEEWVAHLRDPLTIIQPVRDVRTYSRQDQHQLAAKHLYGQAFGFTLDDVEILRQMPSYIRGLGLGDNPDGVANFISDLADRIAALLPPG